MRDDQGTNHDTANEPAKVRPAAGASPRVAIVGGGVAGVATALRLAERGARPVVLERDDRPGGLARCLVFKGVSTDLGPHRIHTELPEVEALVADVCAPALFTVKRRSRIFVRGGYIDYPPSPIGVARRLGMARSAWFAADMALEKLRAPAPVATYESMMRRSFGPALYDFLFRPYSAKVWKTDPAEIHAETARVRVSAGSLAKMIARLWRPERKGEETALREFRYVRGGIETMVRLLVESARGAGAEIRSNAAVRSIPLIEAPDGTLRASGVEIESTGSGDANDSRERGPAILLPADAVVTTAPVTTLLERILPPHPRLVAARDAVSGLAYLNVLFVLIAVRRKVISGDNWLYFPEPEFVFNRAYESKSFDPGMGPDERSVLCVEITTRPGDATDRESDAALSATVVEQMARTGLFRADEVEETMVHRLPFGYPVYSLDYDRRLATALEGLASIGNLVTTGRQGLFNHNNTDHSIHMGLKAAETLLAGPLERTARRWLETIEGFREFRIVD